MLMILILNCFLQFSSTEVHVLVYSEPHISPQLFMKNVKYTES